MSLQNACEVFGTRMTFSRRSARVNFRGYALPKGVDPSIVDKAAKIVPVMFHDPEVVKRMKDSGSPMLIMDRAQVLEMFQKKQETLKALLSDLRK